MASGGWLRESGWQLRPRTPRLSPERAPCRVRNRCRKAVHDDDPAHASPVDLQPHRGDQDERRWDWMCLPTLIYWRPMRMIRTPSMS